MTLAAAFSILRQRRSLKPEQRSALLDQVARERPGVYRAYVVLLALFLFPAFNAMLFPWTFLAPVLILNLYDRLTVPWFTALAFLTVGGSLFASLATVVSAYQVRIKRLHRL